MQPQATMTRRERVPLNGVDTPTLFATIDAVRGAPELAKFQFRASSRWLAGTHSRSQVEAFSGAGGTHRHDADFQFDADHPKVLTGGGAGPTPVEFLLHGLVGCLTAGIANVAAARGRDGSPRSSRASKATSTCGASWVSRRTSATATRASA